MRSIVELIEWKRDGNRHTEADIARIVEAFTSGEMPDYQMAAWLMAAFLRGLDGDETVWLTRAMRDSGRVVDLSSVDAPVADKHSTGGVGDKTTLVLAPLVASCGVAVAKMSGRGLGHTGGTLDKLESIPGFSVEMDVEDFVEQVRRVGIAVIAQSPEICPADKKMYALRDVTGTVPSIPLIVSSILSKKAAGGASAIVLDVKTGSGAFMKTEEEARALARELQRVGRALGLKVQCVVSDMDQPLGRAVGNALEVCEAVRTLHGEGPEDLTELCLELGARMLRLAGVVVHDAEGRSRVEQALADGSALEAFRRWVAAQGGDPRVADDPEVLPRSDYSTVLSAERDGFVVGFDAEAVGRAAVALGAGRETKEDRVDPGAGIVLAVKRGDRVVRGDAIATLYASSVERLEMGLERLREAVRVASELPAPSALFHEV
ncbi:thymidine phosphorylase [Coriobacteriia bacterium Es71-Z0120]|uniref:thymidine phosphorylase n=1 Tax=Parvivirga hydrogeniphila TaxID=2939460 RepID=UPI002260E5C3|nr:thymidine phosphorylase [Parvivirga hydrogeniphila]MCL4079040.1 thymidine phosphorylase [Parvivirga hydrogeniphila]